MAKRPLPTEFTYHDVELYKSESLGSGSYGGVCRAKCDGLLCAAKIMHPTLFDRHDPGTATYLSKFLEECQLLSLARHPNVVQYLGTYVDPDTRLPVLLMELCEESLTALLERSPGPLSYHVQVDICHDIALALVYLHSNGLIHRDLTGNNVLMIAGPRAKITDFGMSKLSNMNPRMTLTLCPGNVLYMSPEALDEANSYTAKLDVFSFGVVIIQLLTRKFPNPIDRFRLVNVPQFEEPLRQEVPETERRAAHLRLIPDTHSLKLLVLQCLKKKEVQRPSALELSERLCVLKQSSPYRESKREGSDVQQLELQLRGQIMLTKAKTKEAEEHLTRLAELERIVGDKDRQVQEKDRELEAKEQELRRKQLAISHRDQSLERKVGELHASEKLVSEFQHSLQQKDKTITDLQQTISVQEIKIQQLEHKDTVISSNSQVKSVTTPHASKMKWRERKNAPEPMLRGTTAVHGNTAYFRPGGSTKVYAYEKYEEQWSILPDNPNKMFGLVVIDGELTSIGGRTTTGFRAGQPTNVLLSLRVESSSRKKWCRTLPPMPTARCSVSCANSGQILVVAGGLKGRADMKVVEVMNAGTKQWTTVSPLPQVCFNFSAVFLGDTLYLAGGFIYGTSKSVFTCSLPDLLASTTIESQIQPTPPSVWRECCNLPVTDSTLVTFDNDLLAIGGRDRPLQSVSNVYRYDSVTDSWTVASQMMNKRSMCFAACFSDNYLIVVGGNIESYVSTNSVEIGEFY